MAAAADAEYACSALRDLADRIADLRDRIPEITAADDRTQLLQLADHDVEAIEELVCPLVVCSSPMRVGHCRRCTSLLRSALDRSSPLGLRAKLRASGLLSRERHGLCLALTYPLTSLHVGHGQYTTD